MPLVLNIPGLNKVLNMPEYALIMPEYVRIHLFFTKQLVYEKVALRWQIPKQLSGLNLLSLSNNKTYRLALLGKF